ncbi:MAG: SRPBCC family protein [Chloroflexi bacterium]|nr:SRPBCC family protein [Chloroflexota bacterium]
MPIFESEFVVDAPLQAVWDFHADPRSLPKIMSGPLRISVDRIDEPVQVGSRVEMTLHSGPLHIPWTVVVRERTAPLGFRDEQPPGEGPWARWSHTHSFEARGTTAALVRDRIEYEPPFGILGRIGAALFGRVAMQMMFIGRRRATRALLENSTTDDGRPTHQ